MIVTKMVTVFGGADFEPAEESVVMVRIDMSNHRGILIPLDAFLALVARSVSFRQLGIALDECLDTFEVPLLCPHTAKVAAAAA